MQEALRHHRKRKNPIVLSKTRRQLIAILDVVIYPLGFLGILAALPQVYEIWVLHNAEGVSVLSWSCWVVLSFFWTMYGLAHKAPAITFINGTWVFVNAMVAVGAYLY